MYNSASTNELMMSADCSGNTSVNLSLQRRTMKREVSLRSFSMEEDDEVLFDSFLVLNQSRMSPLKPASKQGVCTHDISLLDEITTPLPSLCSGTVTQHISLIRQSYLTVTVGGGDLCLLEKADKHYYRAHPFTYKQEWLNSDFECQQNRCVSIQKMDLRDKNIVEIIAKVIEEASDTDDNQEVLLAGRNYRSIHEFASAIPNHLLLGSLLEHLCFVYESNPTRSRMLFKVIGQRLAAMNLLSPLAISDEFSTVRFQHNRAFSELLHAASSSVYPQGQQCLGTNVHNPALRQEEGLFQGQISRYLGEFEEMCRLGKGSYGNVFKVKNKLDGQFYAVKKILIKKASRDDCMKVLREVKVLSSLQHVNVVGYHTAWMEHVQPAAKPDHLLPALDLPEAPDSSDENSDSSSSSIVFQSLSIAPADTDQSAKVPQSATQAPQAVAPSQETGQAVCPKVINCIPRNYVPCVFLGQQELIKNSKCPATAWDRAAQLDELSSRSSIEMNNNSCCNTDIQQWSEVALTKPSKEVHLHLMLYIQMQLCEHSLKDWISERNMKPKEGTTSKCPYECVDTEQTLKLLKQIVEGVDYIHSRGIMHRDLKPRNIFLHGQNCYVRIGDFGLACRDVMMEGQKNTTSSSSENCHTTGVGTFVYAAPEQLKGSHYDSKSDMYSIGVLALELFQPFGTEMERACTLDSLREGRIPESFSQRWPVLTKYIMKLTNQDPSIRPTANQLLQSNLFCNKDIVISGLQKRIEEQEEVIMHLRRQISQLQSS